MLLARVPRDLDPRVWKVLLGVFVSFVGVGLTLPFLLIYLNEILGFGVSTAALMLAWMSIVAMAVTPLAGRVIDRRGPWIVLLLGLVCSAVGSIGLAFVTTIPMAVVTTCLNTVGWTIAASAESTMLSRLAKDTAKEWLFGGQYIVASAGIGVGALIAGFIVSIDDPITFQSLFIIDGVSYLLYAVWMFTFRGAGARPESSDSEEPTGGIREVLADRVFRRFLVIAILFFSCGAGQIESGLPAYATQVAEVSPRVMGAAYVANTLTVVIGTLLALPTIVGRSRTRLLAACGVAWASCWVIIGSSGLWPQSATAAALIILGLVAFSVGEVFASPVAPALVNDVATEQLRGRYNAAFGFTFSLGTTLGPLITAVTIGTGNSNAWIAIVVCGNLIASVMTLRLRSHLTDPQDGRRAPDTAQVSPSD